MIFFSGFYLIWNINICTYFFTVTYAQFKGIVHPKMKILPWFTDPQAILGVYNILLSDELY